MLLGVENEYTVFGADLKPILPDYIKLSRQFRNLILLTLEEALCETPRSLREGSILDKTSVILANGGRLYTDMSTKTEYSSPECVSLKELVCAEKAGELMLKTFYGKENNGENIYCMKRTAIACMESELLNDKPQVPGISWGSHENYLVSLNLFGNIQISDTYENLFLETHLVTRQIYTGAGHLRKIPQTNLALQFLISPRTEFIRKRISSDSVSDRAIIHEKKEFLISGKFKDFARLHLICGDMNRSDWSIFLKIGTTALVLAYLDMLSDKTLNTAQRIALEDKPVDFMRAISNAFWDDNSFIVYKKAIDLQKSILEMIQKKEEELKQIIPEASLIISLWDKALNGEIPYLDWIIKSRIFEEKIGASIRELRNIRDEKLLNQLLSIDFSYHRVNEKDFYEHLIKINYVEPLYNKADVRYFMENPPLGRAQNRVQIIRYLKHRKWLNALKDMTWSKMKLGKGRKEVIIDIDDKPFGKLKSEIDSIIYA